jgi:hypothetical protein
MSPLFSKVELYQDYISKLIPFISETKPNQLTTHFFNQFEQIIYPERSEAEESSHQALFEFVKDFLEKMAPRPPSLMECQRYRRITRLSWDEIEEKLKKKIKEVILSPELSFLEGLEEELDDGIKKGADEVLSDLAESLLEDLLEDTVTELNRLGSVK